MAFRNKTCNRQKLSIFIILAKVEQLNISVSNLNTYYLIRIAISIPANAGWQMKVARAKKIFNV